MAKGTIYNIYSGDSIARVEISIYTMYRPSLNSEMLFSVNNPYALLKLIPSERQQTQSQSVTETLTISVCNLHTQVTDVAVDEEEKGLRLLSGDNRPKNFLTEDELYEVLMQSRKVECGLYSSGD